LPLKNLQCTSAGLLLAPARCAIRWRIATVSHVRWDLAGWPYPASAKSGRSCAVEDNVGPLLLKYFPTAGRRSTWCQLRLGRPGRRSRSLHSTLLPARCHRESCKKSSGPDDSGVSVSKCRETDAGCDQQKHSHGDVLRPPSEAPGCGARWVDLCQSAAIEGDEHPSLRRVVVLHVAKILRDDIQPAPMMAPRIMMIERGRSGI